MNEINEIISKTIVSDYNKKIKEETLEEFLNDFNQLELMLLAVSHTYFNNDFQDGDIIKKFKSKSKEYIIDYIINNLDSVLKAYIKMFDCNTIECLKLIIKKLKEKKYEFTDDNIPFNLIFLFNKFALAKVEYSYEEKKLKIYMPDEYVTIFDKYIDDRTLLEENKRNNEIAEYVSDAVIVYGIIPIDTLHEFFEKEHYKIDINEFYRVIECKSYLNELFYVHYLDEIVVCNVEFFEEDEAYEFYKKQKGDYKLYNKDELRSIRNGDYLKNNKSYQEFVEYIFKNFEVPYDDIDLIREFVVLDYIYLAQKSIKDADESFGMKITDMLEATFKDKVVLKKLMQKIFEDTPKWCKRGNI